MAIRVWTRPDTTSGSGDFVNYKTADAYAVDADHELDIHVNGRLVATYAPGCWHHVETGETL